MSSRGDASVGDQRVITDDQRVAGDDDQRIASEDTADHNAPLPTVVAQLADARAAPSKTATFTISDGEASSHEDRAIMTRRLRSGVDGNISEEVARHDVTHAVAGSVNEESAHDDKTHHVDESAAIAATTAIAPDESAMPRSSTPISMTQQRRSRDMDDDVTDRRINACLRDTTRTTSTVGESKSGDDGDDGDNDERPRIVVSAASPEDIQLTVADPKVSAASTIAATSTATPTPQPQQPPLTAFAPSPRFVSHTQRKLMLQRQQFLHEEEQARRQSSTATTVASSPMSPSSDAPALDAPMSTGTNHVSPSATRQSMTSNSTTTYQRLNPSTFTHSISSPSSSTTPMLTPHQRQFQRQLKDETKRAQAQLATWWSLGVDPMRLSVWRAMERIEWEARATRTEDAAAGVERNVSPIDYRASA